MIAYVVVGFTYIHSIIANYVAISRYGRTVQTLLGEILRIYVAISWLHNACEKKCILYQSHLLAEGALKHRFGAIGGLLYLLPITSTYVRILL